MVLMIDNYDSFTYNLVQYISELGYQVVVKRNDTLTVEDIENMAPSHIVVSPGPCTPNEAGISLAAIEYFAGRIPVLGICLGHQSIAQVFGGDVIRAKTVMHGKTSKVYHTNVGVFRDLPTPYTATRYHSLVVKQETLPECFDITAWTQTADGQIDEIMGLRHKTMKVEGVQFHPESILTEHGHALLDNFFKD